MGWLMKNPFDPRCTMRYLALGGNPIGSHMSTENIQAVEESDDVSTVIAAMERGEIRRVPVTDKNGKLCGIIAQADIATCEEIPKAQVGEVVRMVSERNR